MCDECVTKSARPQYYNYITSIMIKSDFGVIVSTDKNKADVNKSRKEKMREKVETGTRDQIEIDGKS